MPGRKALLLCALALCLAACTSGEQPAAATAAAAGEEPFICIVIRTYWGHGKYGDLSLKKLLSSLQAQKHQR